MDRQEVVDSCPPNQHEITHIIDEELAIKYCKSCRKVLDIQDINATHYKRKKVVIR